MTWVLRDQIDPGNVDKIIDAARHGYKRRKVILPDIDRLRLRRDSSRACAVLRLQTCRRAMGRTACIASR